MHHLGRTVCLAYPWVQHLRIQPAMRMQNSLIRGQLYTAHFYIRDLSIQGFWYLQRSWNQSYGHWGTTVAELRESRLVIFKGSQTDMSREGHHGLRNNSVGEIKYNPIDLNFYILTNAACWWRFLLGDLVVMHCYCNYVKCIHSLNPYCCQALV